MIIQHLANLPSSCPAASSSLESCISALKSSISALESSLKATEGSSSCWETFGWVCAVAVGVGIAGEIAVIVSEYRDDLEDWRRGIMRAPDRPPRWRFWFDIAATLVVLGGVFGEAGASRMVSSINSQLRSQTSALRAYSDQMLAVTTEQAGGAVKSAKLASDEAERAKDRADKAATAALSAITLAGKATNDLASLRNDVTATETRLDDVKKQASDTGEKLSQERAKFAGLSSSIAPRTIRFKIYDDKTTNVEPLKVLAGTEFILQYIRDAEAARAAANIKFLLERAGLKVVSACPLESEDFAWDGVTVETFLTTTAQQQLGSQWASSNNGDVLAEFLIDNNWEATSRYEPAENDLKPNQLRVVVGFKPSPYFEPPFVKAMMERYKSTLRKHPKPLEKPVIGDDMPAFENPVLNCPAPPCCKSPQ